jgi:UDP-N-acetylmuramate dehydrogenase
MIVLDNVPLSGFSTMRLGGPAKHLVEVTSRAEVGEAVAWAERRQLPYIMIGSGSNIIWGDEGFNGLVIVNRIMGFEHFVELDHYITVGAGEIWDEVVRRSVDLNLSGIECLSLIPGTAGATPVQNVGAYGQEIADVLSTLTVFDTDTKKLVTLQGADCNFGYRTSRFKTTDKGRFLICDLTLHLSTHYKQPPFYDSLQGYLSEHKITEYSPVNLRQAVISIRSSKLPDPSVVSNNGSFFHNPVISSGEFETLIANYPGIIHWPIDNDTIKVSAAWLVENAGFKDIHDAETGMATWPRQSLVLVNENATSTKQLLAFRDRIISTVYQKFGITLSQEPELIG